MTPLRAKSSVVKQVEDAVEDLAKKTATPTHLLIDHPAPDGRDRPTLGQEASDG